MEQFNQFIGQVTETYIQIGFLEFIKMILCWIACVSIMGVFLWCIPMTRTIIIIAYNIIVTCYKLIAGLFISMNSIYRFFASKTYQLYERCKRHRYKGGERSDERFNGEKNKTFVNEDTFVSEEERHASILAVNINSTIEEVKSAYKSAIKKYHPDRVHSLGEEFKELAHDKAIEINEAYSFFKEKHGSH